MVKNDKKCLGALLIRALKSTFNCAVEVPRGYVMGLLCRGKGLITGLDRGLGRGSTRRKPAPQVSLRMKLDFERRALRGGPGEDSAPRGGSYRENAAAEVFYAWHPDYSCNIAQTQKRHPKVPFVLAR